MMCIYIYIISYSTISVCMYELVKRPNTHEFTSLVQGHFLQGQRF